MIIHANILDWATSYDGEPFHALLCDPPYHLTEIVKRFGKEGAAPAKGDVYARSARGFMGRVWDGGDVAYRPETWAALAQHLYPGAFGMAFSGSRGWHRMAVAIEGLVGIPITNLKSVSDLLALAIETRKWDLVEEAKRFVDGWLRLTGAIVEAGLIIHPTIFCWSYGSGFPKATRIDSQVDRRAGAERRTVGTKKHQPKFAAAELGYREKDNGYNSKSRESFDVTAPATDLAQAWQGHRYGLQSMKPAIEPIIVFQKPYAGRPVESITATGAGALNVDGGRIGQPHTYTPKGIRPGNGNYIGDDWHPDNNPTAVDGRWPANFALVHHPACNGTCHPDCVVQRLGEQSGESESPQAYIRNTATGSGLYGGHIGKQPQGKQTVNFGDSGTAARFFHQSDWMAERLEAADAVGYFAKASRGEREAGLDPRQIALLNLAHDFDETTVDDGRAKSIDNPYQRGETTRRNTHPTIKPIALTRWLATLLLPPAMYAPRRLLVPFAGAGSEMVGAMLAGWEDVTGIELEADHVAIAEARLAYWQQRRWELLDPAAPITAKSNATMDGQLDMFLEDA